MRLCASYFGTALVYPSCSRFPNAMWAVCGATLFLDLVCLAMTPITSPRLLPSSFWWLLLPRDGVLASSNEMGPSIRSLCPLLGFSCLSLGHSSWMASLDLLDVFWHPFRGPIPADLPVTSVARSGWNGAADLRSAFV
jgi:hypothetical protein